MATARSTVRPVPQRQSRRKLLLLVVVILAGVGGLIYVHGAGSSSKSAAHKHHAVAAGHGKNVYAQRSRRHAAAHPGFVHRAEFARHVLPTLYRATPVFDRAAGDAANASGDLTALQQVCSNYGTRITTLAAQVEGVPHPWAWYTAAGTWRHDLIGVYHYMLGALQQCETAASDGDGASAGSAISDIGAAAQQLHQQVGLGQYYLAHS